jgi:hypothetical protein
MTTTYKYKIGEVLNWHCRPEKSSGIANANVTIVDYARPSVIGKCLTYKVKLANGQLYPDSVYETCLFPVRASDLLRTARLKSLFDLTQRIMKYENHWECI